MARISSFLFIIQDTRNHAFFPRHYRPDRGRAERLAARTPSTVYSTMRTLWPRQVLQGTVCRRGPTDTPGPWRQKTLPLCLCHGFLAIHSAASLLPAGAHKREPAAPG
jgi:hypothetical protein